jgi:hypothetical protein
MLGTTQNLLVAEPNQAPALGRNDLARRLVRPEGNLDRVRAINAVALQAQD